MDSCAKTKSASSIIQESSSAEDFCSLALLLSQSGSLEESLGQGLPIVDKLLSFDRVTVSQLSASTELQEVVVSQATTSLLTTVELERGYGVSGRVINSGKVFLETKDSALSKLVKAFPKDPLCNGPQPRSVMSLPIRFGGRVIGALSFCSAESDAYGDAEVVVGEKIATLLGGTFERFNYLELERLLGTLQDTASEREVVQDELRKNKDFLQSIIDNTLAVIFVKLIDGRYVLINDEFLDMFRLTREEVMGRTDEEIFPSDFAATFRANDVHVAESGEVLKCEEAVPHKSGMRTYLSVKFPVRDESGEVYGVGGVATDITYLKQVEDELRDANLFLDSIIEHIPNMVFVKEPKQLRFVRFNRAGEELLGQTRGDLIGKNDYDFFPKEQADFFTAKDREVLEKTKLLDIEDEPIDTKHLGKRFLHTKKIAVVDEHGESKYLLGISEDITEQKRSREALVKAHEELEQRVQERTAELREVNKELKRHVAEREEANVYISKSLREKELLLKEIHHRVKNNMQVISSLLKLQSHYVKDEKARGLFKQSDLRVRSMALIHERLYRSEGLAEIELRDYITELAEKLFRSYAVGTEKVQLMTDLQSVCVGIDQAIPCGLLLNEFISNALKHAFSGKPTGVLSVTLKEESGVITLKVADNGCGLPEDFDIEHPISLGFEIIRTLSEQLDAKLVVKNSNPTEFDLSFRRASDDPEKRTDNGNGEYFGVRR